MVLMNKLYFFLIFAAASSLLPQTLENEDLNIHTERLALRFASNVADLNDLDLANMPAVRIESGQTIAESQLLKRGKGTTVSVDRDSGLQHSTEVSLAWSRALDAHHMVASYEWEWVAASSSHSDFVQVFELHNGKVFVTQQIEADTHHGGRAVGAAFNGDKQELTVKAVNYAAREGRCCPSLMGVVVFRWDGQQFHRIHASRVPLPKS
jgi:hypothetical protein